MGGNQLGHNYIGGYHEKIMIIHSLINLRDNHKESHCAHSIKEEDKLDLLSFVKNILIVSPEWDERSRRNLPVTRPNMICHDITKCRVLLRLSSK
jgi:hypothetical protein